MVEDNVPARSSPFGRPPSPAPSRSASVLATPRRSSEAPRGDNWRIVKWGLIGLAAVIVVGLLVTVGRRAPEGLAFFAIASGGGAMFWFIGRQRREARTRHLEHLQQEAKQWAARADVHGLRAVSTRLILKDDEHALLEQSSSLMETRAYRVYGGGGTRIGRVYVGGGVSESQQRWRLIDQGTLTLTTKRLVFDGSQENRSIQLSHVLSVNAWSDDAIEVSTQGRTKSQVYRVRNPLIWVTAVHVVATGNFKMQTSGS